MEIIVSRAPGFLATIYWDNGGNDYVSFTPFDRFQLSGLFHIPEWEDVARLICRKIGTDTKVAIPILIALCAVQKEGNEFLEDLSENYDQLFYEVCSLQEITLEDLRRIRAQWQGRQQTQTIKKKLVKLRRSEFQGVRKETVLLMLDAGHAYVCAKPGCEVCSDLTIDHKKPLSRGGSDAVENLQFMCRPHNSQKGARDDPAMVQAPPP